MRRSPAGVRASATRDGVPWRARRVVVGYDGSTSSRPALAWAAREAGRHGARLLVPVSDGDVPVRALLAACRGTDLLVLGRSSDRHGAHRALVRACLRAAPCPVVVTPPEPAAPRHHVVLVGVDCTPAARAALALAAAEAALRGDPLHAVNAVQWDSPAIGLIRPSTRDLVAWGRHLVDSELHGARVDARPVIIPGRAAEVLVRHSAHADLLVVGSHARGPFLSRTVARCVDEAACPVLVVRAPVDPP